MFKRFGVAVFSRRLASTAARAPQTSSSLAARRLKVAFNAISGVVFIYVGGSMVAMENDGFYRVFDRYVPYGAQLLEHIEQYQHDRRMRSYQERARQQEQGSSPYIRRKYSNEDAEKQQQHEVAAVSSCSSSGEGSDPLSPQRFFDAQSGNIEERDYLPLVLLPDIRDPLIHRVSFALNDLIASVNASAASADTILNAATALQTLADDVQQSHRDYCDRFAERARTLKTYAESNDRSEHQLKLLSDEIMAIENMLVQHVNTRNCSVKPAQQMTTTGENNMPFSLVSNNSEVVLQLQLSFSQLIAILHNQSSIPLGPYIQGLKDAVESFELASRQELINNALNGLTIPDDVDLNPIINDIINS